MNNYILFVIVLAVVFGCSTSGTIDEETIFTEIPQSQLYKPSSALEREAYSKGVQDAYSDFMQKLQGSKAFVYEPAIIECGVEFPAQIINGMLKPKREECVQYKPGGFVENGKVVYPNLNK